MEITAALVVTSVLLGVGLAMDAFSVSMANGLNEPTMKARKMGLVAGTFALFQFAMPLLGWFCVTTIARIFAIVQPWIPWISLLLLSYIGGKMLYEGIKYQEEDAQKKTLDWKALLLQGIATSIDALSVGFTIADYGFVQALIASLLIGLVTLLICYIGLFIGKKMGTRLAGKAGILGGVILILIGLRILIQR